MSSFGFTPNNGDDDNASGSDNSGSNNSGSDNSGSNFFGFNNFGEIFQQFSGMGLNLQGLLASLSGQTSPKSQPRKSIAATRS